MSLIDLLRNLVGIDSVNPDLVADGAGEASIVQFIVAWATQRGLESHIIEPEVGRPSVVVIARGTGGGKSLMLNGHIDTVGVAGMVDPFVPRLEQGKLYGRGSYDMKGSVAASLWAAAAAAHSPLRGDVVVACVADEEVASIGTQAVLAQWRTDACIVTEPTSLDVCVAHKGFVWLEVEIQGRAAHGSKPEFGIDAIAKAGHVLIGITQLDHQLRTGTHHPLLGTGSVHVSLIAGGQELSSYSERCTIHLERRTIPGETSTQVEAEIQAILEEAARVDPAFRATWRTTLKRPPFEGAADAPIVNLLCHHVSQQVGHPPRVVGETPWMDAAFTAAAGIPTVVFGPHGAGAHAVEEWVEVASVEQCANILLAVAQEFCK